MAVTSPSISGVTVSTSNTTSRTIDASFSGGVSGRYYIAQIYRAGGGGFPIGTGSRTGPGTISITYTHSGILTQLDGASSLGWYVVISEWASYQNYLDLLPPMASASSSVAAVTISLRYTDVSHSNAPYDLDGTGQIIAVASRPSSHAGWRVRYQFYVNNTLAFSRGFFSSSSSTTTLTFTPTAEEKAALLNAMGGVSPRTMEVRAVTGWNLSGGTTTLSGTNSSSQTNNLIKLFSSIKVRLAGVWTGKPIKVRVAGVWKNAIVKVWTGSSWKQAK